MSEFKLYIPGPLPPRLPPPARNEHPLWVRHGRCSAAEVGAELTRLATQHGSVRAVSATEEYSRMRQYTAHTRYLPVPDGTAQG